MQTLSKTKTSKTVNEIKSNIVWVERNLLYYDGSLGGDFFLAKAQHIDKNRCESNKVEDGWNSRTCDTKMWKI